MVGKFFSGANQLSYFICDFVTIINIRLYYTTTKRIRSMVESSFENKLVIENGNTTKEVEASSLVATYALSEAVDFV